MPRVGVQRSLDNILIPSGVINVDRGRSPWYYSHKKGSKPNIWPPLNFVHPSQDELSVKPMADTLMSKMTDWKEPDIRLPTRIFYTALYGTKLEDQDHREQYMEWLREMSTKLAPYYLAYRTIQTIGHMTAKERGNLLDKLGVEYHKEEPFIDMPLIFRDYFKDYLEQLP